MADNAFDAMNDDTGNAFDALESGRSGQLRVTARKVSGVNPDQRAESLRLSADMGLPFDVVERNLSEVKKKREDNAFDALATDPALASWIVSDQNNAALAKDDVPTLTGLSRAMQSAGDVAGQVPSEFNRFFGRGVSGLGDLNDAGANMLGRGIERIPLVGESIANFLRTPIPAWASPSVWARGAGGFIEREFTTQLPEERRNLATDVAGGIGQLIGQGVVTYANPASAVALNLGVGADQAADMAREEGAEGTFGADAAVLASAPVAAALEKLGLSKLLERAPPGIRNAMTRYVVDKVVAAGVEGTQEAAEQVAYNAIAELAYNPDQSLTEGLGENFTVGAAVGAVARVLVGARFARSRTEREAETLDAMEAAAGASLLRTRDPARFAAMVRQLAASGADTVFVDAEQAQTYFQSASLDPTSLGIDAEALSEAVALGGDLAIPMETWLTTIAPDHGAAMREFRRIGQASLAPGEVAGEEVELDEAAERFLASVEEGGTTDSRVFDDVLGQLLGTDMDRATAEKNATLMQSVFRSLAARSGRDAWSLYEQYGLRIVRERPEATAVLRRVPNIDATIDSMLDRLAAGDIPTEADVFGPTISEFLSVAGIRPAENEPMTGEIARLNEDDRFTRKGKKRLVRPDDPAALTLDYAREAAVEAGFLPEGADINDLLDALGADRRMDVPQDQALADLRNALLELDEEVNRLGLDPVQDREEVKRRLFPSGEFDQPAFHGTPHTVDRFSLQKIGTGEGAQAYGWGLYFASMREVAESYRRDLAGDGYRTASGGIFNPSTLDHLSLRVAARRNGTNLDATIARGEELLQNEDEPALRRMIESDLGALKLLRDSGGLTENLGNLYQVEVPDDADLLDWDRPLSEQPEKARAAMESIITGDALDPEARREWESASEEQKTGKRLYTILQQSDNVDGARGASEVMLAAGIPGLRYLDGNSRSDWQLSPPSQTAAGDWMVKDRSKPDSKGLHFDNEADARAELERRQKQTHNYVIWDEAAISEPTTLFQSDVARGAAGGALREVQAGDLVDGRVVREEIPNRSSIAASVENPRVLSGVREVPMSMFDAEYISSIKGGKLDARTEALRQEIAESGELNPLIVALDAEGAYIIEGGHRFDALIKEGANSLPALVVIDESNPPVTEFNQSPVAQTDTPEFKRWFGDSKVVDENGVPLVVYHASTFGDIEVFDKAEQMKGMAGYGFYFSDKDGSNIYAEHSHKFKADRDFRGNPKRTNIVPAYLKIENPLRADNIAEISQRFGKQDPGAFGQARAYAGLSPDAKTAIQRAGYDGVIATEYVKRMRDGSLKVVEPGEKGAVPHPVYAVFEPEQIKSATGNRGTFDPNDPSILNQANFSKANRNSPSPDSDLGKFVQEVRADFERNKPRLLKDAGPDIVDIQLVGSYARGNPTEDSDIDLGITVREGVDINEAIEKLRGQLHGIGGVYDIVPSNQGALSQSDPTTEAIRRGYIKFTSDRKFTIGLTENADLSTFLHESAHFFLEVMGDLASDSANTPQGLVDDYMAILRWLGAPRREEIGVEQHEQFARGFEAYIGEGKPPTPELAGAFARFRAWMKAIYKTLTALDVSLTDEVRGVFDRLVAGDEAIRRAEEAVNVEPLFKEAERAGMSEARFREYLRLQQAGHDEAEARLTAQAMKEVQRETQAWWREESARVREEVAAEVYATPVYRAWAALARNQQPDGTALDTPPVKLDKGWLLDKYGQEFLNKNLLRKNVYAVEGGISGDIAAGLFGFRTGDELVTALANAAPMKAWIKAETDARMRERHGDMRLDGSLPEKAMAAVHNSKRMKAIAADIALLEGLAGEPAMNPAALRQWAEARIARTPIRKLTPYAFLRSERKHAREAVKAAAAGKWSEALVAQRRRLAHAHLYDVAVKAQEQAEKRTRWLARQNRATTQERLAKAGPGYREQVNAILAAVGLRQPEQGERGALRAFLDQLQEAGDETAVADAVIALVDGGKPTELRDLTVADFRAVYDAVRNLAHLAGQRNRLVAAADKIAFDEAVTAMIERAAEVNPDRLPEELSRRDLSLTDRAVDRVRRFASELDRPENIIEALDGGEAGPWHAYFWQALNRAEDTAIGLRRRVGAQLKALRKSMPDDFMASLDARVDLPFGANVSRGTLIGMVLNTGNAGNLQRLRDGGIFVNGAPVRLTDAQVAGLRELLTADELRYVQGLWDAVNSLWPDITALQKAMSGIAPEKVEAQAFEVGGATYRGGYWPLAYDHSKSNVGERQADDDALRVMMGAGYTRATTPKGYQKQRVEELSAPLQLDFGAVMAKHLDNVMTDIAYRAAVKDTVRILRSTRVKDAIISRLGKGAYDTLKGSVAYAVASNELAGQAATTARRMVSGIVSNSAVSALAIRPDIALGNYASAMMQALDRVGTRSLMRGWWAMHTPGRADLTAEITSLSPFMAGRLADIDHFYRLELDKAQGRAGFGDAYRRVMMTLHRWADHDVTRAAWWGRYQEALAAGENREEAVRLADKMIRQTQTANARKDVSAIERDAAFRESRMFMGPMFVILGRLRAAGKGEGATRTVGLRAASLLRQMFLAPALFVLAAGRWPEDGGDDDDDIGAGEWALWLATNTLLFPLQAVPILREIAGSVEAWATDRPINPRAAPTTQAAAGLVKASKSIADNIDDYQDTGELDWLEMTRDLTSAVGPFTGLPAGQTRITTRTIEAIADDPDANAMEMTRMAVYGPPKH